jgi:hypothetical protein
LGVPVHTIQALQYLLIVGFIDRAVAPYAIGVPFEKDDELAMCKFSFHFPISTHPVIANPH